MVRLAALAIALGIVPAGEASPPPAAPADLSALLEEARKVQEADVLAWGRHRFRRRALREKLDARGRLMEKEDLEFVVTPVPTSTSFDERLVRIGGRTPTTAEVDRHRRETRFSRHYRALSEGEGREEQGGYSLRDLLRMSSYRYAGRETIDGADCHRLDFGPAGQNTGDGIAGRIAASMAGSLWLTEEGLHISRATARSVNPISIVFALAKVTGLRVSLDSTPTVGGPWLPKRIEVWTDSSVLGFGIHRHNLYEYLEFEPR